MKLQYISLLFLILLIFFRFYSTGPVYHDSDHVRIRSRVYNEPLVFAKDQYLVLQGLKIYLPKYPEITYGDTIIVEGKVSDKKLKDPVLKSIETEKRGILLNFRQKLITFYKSSLPEPYSSLVAGMVIGSKNMPEAFWQRLKSTGTAHVVVASGTNVTLTASFLISLLTIFLKRRYAIWLTIAGILGYVIISGLDAPIVRAGIMGGILLFSQGSGRVVNTWRILIYSCLIMLVIKPTWITDLGFILSFVATISLMALHKIIDLKLKLIPAGFREGLSTSIAAQIGVAPIIFITFGQFNILSPIINALVLWTIPYIMVLGAIGGIIGLIVPFIGRLILFAVYPLLLWFVKIIEIFSTF